MKVDYEFKFLDKYLPDDVKSQINKDLRDINTIKGEEKEMKDTKKVNKGGLFNLLRDIFN